MGLRKRTPRCLVGRSLGIGAVVIGLGTACPFDGVPPCPGQCFAFTLERTSPISCNDDESTPYPIAFTGPNGYRGRTCFNSSSIPLVVEAIEHLRAGGQLSELSAETVGAYVSTVDAVQADLEAECILAAAGQCINEAQICTVIGSDAYQALVIEESCVLALDGTEPVTTPDGSCEAFAIDQATSSPDGGDHCPDATTTAATSLDDTGGSDTADDTSSDTGTMASAQRATP